MHIHIDNLGRIGKSPGSNPYTRKVIYFKNEYGEKLGAEVVKIDKISIDHSDFVLKYQPHHPAANEKGYVKYPNVNIFIETVDANYHKDHLMQISML